MVPAEVEVVREVPVEVRRDVPTEIIMQEKKCLPR